VADAASVRVRNPSGRNPPDSGRLPFLPRRPAGHAVVAGLRPSTGLRFALGFTEAVNKIAEETFPPRNLTDAEALAACGPTALPHLRFKNNMTGTEQAACVRALRLIGGDESEELVRAYHLRQSRT
jgi:hypothetical protein